MSEPPARSPPLPASETEVAAGSPAASEARQSERCAPGLWVSTTYFAEGFPYAIVNNIAEVLFAELGASLRAIGLTSLFHLPWNLKFLWGPLVDHYETKRRWLLGVEVLLSVVLVALASFAARAALLPLLSATFVVLAVAAATHDIAIDGFYLECLDERGQSRFVGLRAMAYKIAGLVVRGPGLMLVSLAGWTVGLLGMAATMALLTLAHALLLPRSERRQRPLLVLGRALGRAPVVALAAVVALLVAVVRHYGGLAPFATAWRWLRGHLPVLKQLSLGSAVALGLFAVLLVLLGLRKRLGARFAGGGSRYAAAFVDFLAQPAVGRILAFVVLFRAGESLLQKMKWPFMRDAVGISLATYGFANGTLGVIASFVATLAGGWLIARHGLRRWIWPFALAQNVLHLLYVMLAAMPHPSLATVTAVITIEHFGEGLGTAVFMVFLMRCCDPAHKAAHMAILTALMSVSFTIAGVSSGYLAERVGFGPYFLLTFVASIPGMALILVLPHRDRREPAPRPGIPPDARGAGDGQKR